MSDLNEMEAAKKACDESEKVIYKVRNIGYSEPIINGMIKLKQGDC